MVFVDEKKYRVGELADRVDATAYCPVGERPALR
jgi:hypothetical protein